MEGINSGDTAWVLISTALVLMMTPALAFFYGGMVRKKNVLSTLNLSFIMMALISIQWVLFGYTLAFGDDIGGLIGGLTYLGLTGVGAEPNADYAATIPHPALRRLPDDVRHHHPGADHRRLRGAHPLQGLPGLRLLWATLVYDPVAHWVWGVGGILRELGRAGLRRRHGGAHHRRLLGPGLCAGDPRARAASATARWSRTTSLHVLGAGLLWVGWFGFNGGSALAANGLAVTALVNTNTAAAAAGLVWMVLSWRDNKPSVLGIVTGAVVGLVAITPAAGFVTPLAAMVIGAVAAPISYYAISCARAGAWTNRWTCGPATAWAALGARWQPASSPPRRSTRPEPTVCSTATPASS